MRRLAIVVLLAGCSGGGASGGGDRTPATGAPASFARYDAGAVPGGPGRGARYAFGHAPSDSLVASLDTDVGATGAELPAGSGRAADGAVLFAAQCASCHGAKGEGIAPNPALIGRDPASAGFAFGSDPKLVKTVGNYWPYATTLFDYIKRAMPLSAPGSLSDDQVYALTAYILSANDILAADAVLDAASLRAVRMPARDRFVVDDRTGGPEVK